MIQYKTDATSDGIQIIFSYLFADQASKFSSPESKTIVSENN